MRQRYYNTEIKRFVNQDILTGSAGNSQSLNRYSYVQGNPVKYTDPFGLSPINGLFSGSNIRHALLGFASCIPVIGVIASAVDAWYYYKEGNTARAMACTVDAVIGLLSGGGSLLTKFAKTEQIGRAIQVAAKIGNGGVGLYRNATTFGKSAVDFYVRHEGTFFTKNFQWELADAGDFLSMALSGAGAAQSAAGMASGINEAAKAYRQWEEINVLKKLGEGGRGTLSDETFTRYMLDGRQVTDVTNLPGSDGIRIPRRLTTDEMIFLTQEYGVEFAQVYHYGQGKNGGGGYYVLYSGTVNRVNIAKSFAADAMLINHTHPSGTAYPSSIDLKLLQDLQNIGSPQKVSEIIPIGKKKTVFFDVNGVKR